MGLRSGCLAKWQVGEGARSLHLPPPLDTDFTQSSESQHPHPSVHLLLVPEQLRDLDEPFPSRSLLSIHATALWGRQSWDQVFLTNFQASGALTRMLRGRSCPPDFPRRSSSCPVLSLLPADPSKLSFLVPSSPAMLALRHYCIRGWRESSAVKSTGCSC